MVKVIYVDQDGVAHSAEAALGDSLMQTAIAAGIDGIVGECGGSAMCATCHVYVRPEWLGRLPPRSEVEEEMLECTAAERRPESRLSCQILATPDLDGIVVDLPETQL